MAALLDKKGLKVIAKAQLTGLNPPPFKSRRVLLFYCVLLFFASFYFYHPCFCYVLKMLSMDASLAIVAEAREYDDRVVDDALLMMPGLLGCC